MNKWWRISRIDCKCQNYIAGSFGRTNASIREQIKYALNQHELGCVLQLTTPNLVAVLQRDTSAEGVRICSYVDYNLVKAKA